MSNQHPLLRYAIVTTPSELVEGTTAALTILATNAGSVAREIESLTITLPTNLWAGGAVNVKAPTGWAGAAKGGVVTLTPTPAGSTASLKPGGTLLFTLADVQLTATPSLAYVTIHEVVGQAKADSYVWLVARESGAPTLALRGDEEIAPGARASLHWSGPEHATFTLYSRETPGGIPLRGTGGDYPVAPTMTTAYTLVAVYTDPETKDTSTIAKQWTITVMVPPPKIKRFTAETVGVSRVVRFDFEVEHAASLEIVQSFPGTTDRDELLWDSEGGAMTSPQEFTISGEGGSSAAFRLTARRLPSAPHDQSQDAACTIPVHRLLAYAAYVDGDTFFAVTAIEAATTATLKGRSDVVISKPNGVQVTKIPTAALFADPPALTGPGQAVVFAPPIYVDGNDLTSFFQGGPATDDLQALARLLGQDDVSTASLDQLQSSVIRGLTDGIGGFASDDARRAAIARLQRLSLAALIDEALVTGFVWRAKLATPPEIQAGSAADLTEKVRAWCRKRSGYVPYERLDARALVGAAIVVFEQGGLIDGERERSHLFSSRPLFLPLARLSRLSLPGVGRFFWIQLKATDGKGDPMVLVPSDDGTGLRLAVRALDDRQLWRIDHVSDDTGNHWEHVKLWNRGLRTYIKSDWGFHEGDPMDVIFAALVVDDKNATGNLFFPISQSGGQNFNAFGEGPYNAGNEVAGYDWCDGQDNEYWQLIEAPGDCSSGALATGDGLGVGTCLRSPGWVARMVLQMDGNLVIEGGKTVLWASGTFASPSPPRRVRLLLEADGLNLYDANNKRLWSSGDLPAGCRAVLGDDGVLRLMDFLGETIRLFPATLPALPEGDVATDIAVGPKGEVAVCAGNGSGTRIYQWKAHGWVNVGSDAERVAIAPDGTKWCSDPRTGAIYFQAADATVPWNAPQTQVSVVDVAADPTTGWLYVIERDHSIGRLKHPNESWERYELMLGDDAGDPSLHTLDLRLSRLAVDSEGGLWMTDGDAFFWRMSFGPPNPSFPSFPWPGPQFIDIGSGGGATWATGPSGTYRYEGSSWIRLGEPCIAIDVGPDGVPWVIDSHGRVRQWTRER